MTRKEILSGLDAIITAEQNSRVRIQDALINEPHREDLKQAVLNVAFNLAVLTAARRKI